MYIFRGESSPGMYNNSSARLSYVALLVLVITVPVVIHGWQSYSHSSTPQQLRPRQSTTSRFRRIKSNNRLCHLWISRTATTTTDNNNHDDDDDTQMKTCTEELLHHQQQHVVSRRKWFHQSSRFTSVILPFIVATTTATSTRVAVAASTILPPLPQFDSEEIRRISIFERTSPSVVFIDTFLERRDSYTTNNNNNALQEIPLGSGSGFVWDKEGHIVTNYHVVQNAQSAQVTILLSGPDDATATKMTLNDNNDNNSNEDDNYTLQLQFGGSTGSSAMTTTTGNGRMGKNSRKSSDLKGSGRRRVFTAKIVGVDPGKDIAVLQIDADPSLLYPISVGTSTNLKVGQQAMAIGNPFGLDHTLTVGVISGTNRQVRSPIGRPITEVIQTDAAINPGNSGGPLLDSSGRLIGMNTAIFSPSGASAGIGFAIPIDTVQSIVTTLIRDGQIIRPILGISLLGTKQAKTLGIDSGVLVLDVPPRSPADQAGLKGTRRTESGFIELGDIITDVNHQTIDVDADLFQALEGLQPGDIVEVKIRRMVAINDEIQMKPMTIYIKLQPSPPTIMQRSFGTSSTIQQQQQQQQPDRYPIP